MSETLCPGCGESNESGACKRCGLPVPVVVVPVPVLAGQRP
ncbi:MULTISPECIES: hypothetical protein [Streptomyces]|uniref:Uncharacterized protein n=1 Tax=Streptomyces rimosus subsp. rimosus TaxID=132474 RepID=A0ABY3Z9M3_STRRM|nr:MULTISPECIES: hypothetical protein [Streptomyces]UNZ06225.1 hypothetical protein SRIMR7_29165 [Streptomyces rimosus subsp. rimosus]UTH97681.1 hypothetical protein SRIMHP_26540 [Streptomyces rimosus subsp. rimosus]UTJ15779.1 hypothetical protein SRIMDV3_26440 [Streptomyces rimosus subsp. rimosus]